MNGKPIVDDLYCGLGGWAEGFMAEGYRCRGYDIEAHDYGTGGYPGELILRDVRSIHGSELKDAAVIVGSSPCQEFSYRAMPWKRAKALPPPYLGMELFNAQFRIQREASEAAGHHIPMVVENVRGAQKWVGRAAWNYGSFYLWGDVPALMPMRFKGRKNDGSGWRPNGTLVSCNRMVPDGLKVGNAGARTFQERRAFAAENPEADPLNWWHAAEGLKRPGRTISAGFNNWPKDETGAYVLPDGTKIGGDWFSDPNSTCRKHGSRSLARKYASARIKIPYPLALHIARTLKPLGVL